MNDDTSSSIPRITLGVNKMSPSRMREEIEGLNERISQLIKENAQQKMEILKLQNFVQKLRRQEAGIR